MDREEPGRPDDASGKLRWETEHEFEQLRSEMHHMHRDLVARLDRYEATILSAFCGFAESTDKRLSNIDANMAMFMSRLDTLESRVLVFEKRLSIPPTA
jgi:hypothetical protein